MTNPDMADVIAAAILRDPKSVPSLISSLPTEELEMIMGALMDAQAGPQGDVDPPPAADSVRTDGGG